MEWLKCKVNEHNNKRSYIDQEEYWDVSDYIISIIVHCVLFPILFIIIALYKHVYVIIVISIIYSILMVIWHMWHLMN